MPNPTEIKRNESAPHKPSMGLVMELEKVVFPGRRMLYDTAARVLKAKDIELTSALFVRHKVCYLSGAELVKFLAACGKKKLSADKLITEIQDQFIHILGSNKIKMDAAVVALVSSARKADIAIGVMSFLPDGHARRILEQCGLDTMVKLQVNPNGAPALPKADTWLKLAKLLGLHPRRCLALASCEVSCKSALAAGMRCVVIPDEFTMYQDFSGADLVVEEAQALHWKDMVSLMRTCSFG